jgi:predicted metalloprotease
MRQNARRQKSRRCQQIISCSKLQTDFYVIWTHYNQKMKNIEDGDLEEALAPLTL